jgi:hypothetical protein
VVHACVSFDFVLVQLVRPLAELGFQCRPACPRELVGWHNPHLARVYRAAVVGTPHQPAMP